jgi:predicted ABC-type transport system involved in lysophospholipase L1 biosynthesis ATPase subunit
MGSARQVMALILDHVHEHTATLMLVNHHEELAASCTDRVVWLVDGGIAAVGI